MHGTEAQIAAAERDIDFDFVAGARHEVCIHGSWQLRSEEMKPSRDAAKHRPSFLSNAPAAFSRWESRDVDAAEALDLEKANGELPRSNSKSSISSSISNRMSAADRWKNYAAQLVYSPVAKFYYAFMIAVTLFEICVTLYDPHHLPHTRWFLGIELFMVAMLMNEVAVSFHFLSVNH